MYCTFMCYIHLCITITALATTSILLHNYHFFFVVRMFKIYCLNNIHIYITDYY